MRLVRAVLSAALAALLAAAAFYAVFIPVTACRMEKQAAQTQQERTK